MAAASLWENIAGWAILCLAFFFLAAIVLWPVQRVLHRLWPRFKLHWIVRMALTAVVAAAIWFATPWLLRFLST